MPNALQDFMRSVASGQQDITAPYFRGYGLAQQRAQQQALLAERQRQFNLSLPIRGQIAGAQALTAQTGANKYATRNEDLASKTRAAILGQMSSTLGGFGDVEGQSNLLQQAGTPQNVYPMDAAAAERAAREKKITQVGAEAAERSKYQKQTASFKAGLKSKTDPILRRQLINRIAQAQAAKARLEAEIGKAAAHEDDPRMAQYFTKAREEAEFNVSSAARIFQAYTGEQPNPAEINAAILGATQPAPTTGGQPTQGDVDANIFNAVQRTRSSTIGAPKK